MALGLGLGLGSRKKAVAADAAITALFSGSEPGFWFDPSDFSTMFQDSAGTIPVTATGQPVGKINDKSGRGNHATQATAASRPTLQQDAGGRYYLSFDGTDDSMATAAINMTTTDAVSVGTGIYKQSDAARGILIEFSPVITTNNGAFSIEAPNTAATAQIKGNSKGTLEAPKTATGAAAGNPFKVLLLARISTDFINIRVNGVDLTDPADQGTGNYGNYSLYIGRRNNASLPYNGRIYSLLGLGRAFTAGEITSVESYLSSKSGAP